MGICTPPAWATFLTANAAYCHAIVVSIYMAKPIACLPVLLCGSFWCSFFSLLKHSRAFQWTWWPVQTNLDTSTTVFFVGFLKGTPAFTLNTRHAVRQLACPHQASIETQQRWMHWQHLRILVFSYIQCTLINALRIGEPNDLYCIVRIHFKKCVYGQY